VLFVIRPLINYLLPLLPVAALAIAALWRKPPCLKSSLVLTAAGLMAFVNGFTRHGHPGWKLALALLLALLAWKIPDTKPHHWGRRLRWLTAGLLLLGCAWKAVPYLTHPPDPCAKWVDELLKNPAPAKGETLLFYGDPVEARVVQFYCDYNVRWTDQAPPQRPKEAMLFEYRGQVLFLPSLNSN
jgi:hypothetical protein